MTLDQKKSAVAWLSVASNVTLVAMKGIVGCVTGSVSVLSEAIHSGVDLLAAVIALIAVKTSSKPPDFRHPFGHGKAENISGTIEAMLIFAAAAWIIYEAIEKIINPREMMILPQVGLAVMGFSSLANWLVSKTLFRVGKQTDSIALQADGWHLRTDVYTSLGVMVAMGVIWGGNWILPGHWQIVRLADPVAAILVATLILRAAWKLTLQAGRDLMDENLPAEELVWMYELLGGLGPRVHGFHRLRARKSGQARFIEFHLFVDPQMTVQESHKLSHQVAGRVKDHFPQSQVNMHVEPYVAPSPEQATQLNYQTPVDA